MTTESSLLVEVAVQSDLVDARVLDRRPDALAVFATLSDAQRAALVSDAWSIGLRALTNAYRHAEETRLQDIGKTLFEDFGRQLSLHQERQASVFTEVVTRYFDPKDGQVVARLDAFLRDGGPLTNMLNHYLAPKTGLLAETLAREVGEQSAIFKKLNPAESEGLVQVLEARLRVVMEAGHTEVVRALDPLATDGAVARFLRSLREELTKSDASRSEQLARATAALDANNENSLLSRMMRETQLARQSLLQAINPDVPGSPLALLKSTITGMLQEHAKSQKELMTLHQERQTKLETEIRDAVVQLQTQRKASLTSPRGGFDFQDAVVSFVQAIVQGAPLVAEGTRDTVGLVPNCRKGDAVARFTAESAFVGASVVVEAKRDQTFNLSKALEEMDIARRNRGATVGLFVMAKSHAPVGFPQLARFGNDVVVVWDHEDEASDPYLRAAMILALGLASRKRAPDDIGDIKALSDIEQRVLKEVERLDKMKRLNDGIQKNSTVLSEEIRKGADKLDVLVRKAKATLKALNVELSDAEHGEGTVALPLLQLASAETANVVREAQSEVGTAAE